MKLFIGPHVIFLQVVLVFLLCFLTLNPLYSQLFNKIFEKIYPTKILIGIVASCLLLIGFVISFHSEVFTSHDVYNVAEGENGSKKNAYDWFNLSHVYRFPIEQFSPESAIIQINEFDFESYSNTKIDHYLFIIDRTRSTNETAATIKITKSVQDKLKNSLGENMNKSRETLYQLASMSDLLLFFTMYNQYLHSKSLNSRVKFKVGIYWGDRGQRIEYLNNYDFFSLEKIDDLVDNYFKIINNKKIKSDTTDYVELINDVCRSGCNDGGLTPDSTANFAITLIGDLYHESEKTMPAIVQSLTNLSYRNIEQISLFRLPINSKSLYSQKKVIEAEVIATKIESHIRERFKKYLLYSEIKTLNIVSMSNYEDFINSQIVQPNKTLGTESEISMYFPFLSANGLVNSTANIRFKYQKKDLNKPIFVTLKSNDDGETSGELRLNNKQIIRLNEMSKVDLDEGGGINFSFVGSRSNENYYLDLYFPEAKKRISSQLVFREKLTHTASLCLIFLYTFLYSSTTILLVICGLSFYHTASDRLRSVYGSLLMIIPSLIFIFSYIPNIVIFLNLRSFSELYSNKEYWIKITLAFVFPFLYVLLLFKLNYKEIREAINHIND